MTVDVGGIGGPVGTVVGVAVGVETTTVGPLAVAVGCDVGAGADVTVCVEGGLVGVRKAVGVVVGVAAGGPHAESATAQTATMACGRR